MNISVVVTTYNLELYIEECLISIKNQTLPPHEIILADDASTDSTINIARRIFPEIIIIQQNTNCGALKNTLSGLMKVTGDIVAFIDGDDTWPAKKLECVASNFANDESAVLLSHGHRRVNSIGEPTGEYDATHWNIDRILSTSDKEVREKMLRQSVLMREGIWFGSAYSIRKSSIDLVRFKKLVLSMQESRNAYLDLVLAPYIVAINSNSRVLFSQDVIFDYRIHLKNSAASNNIEKQLHTLKCMRATNFVTRNCLISAGVNPAVIKKYNSILKEYDYLEALYTRKITLALRLAFSLKGHFLKKRILIKELSRFVLVVAFGVNFFLTHK